jgi:hypothetical protein
VTAAQSIGPHTIKGTVYVRGERPSHIEVVLENGTRMPLSRTVADQDGRYTFSGLGFGTYGVVVQPLGEYRGAAQEVEIFGSPDSIIIKTVDLSLEPKGGRRCVREGPVRRWPNVSPPRRAGVAGRPTPSRTRVSGTA